jgi:hypothetical protein
MEIFDDVLLVQILRDQIAAQRESDRDDMRQLLHEAVDQRPEVICAKGQTKNKTQKKVISSPRRGSNPRPLD